MKIRFYKYESIMILRPDMTEDKINDLIKKYTDLFTAWGEPIKSKFEKYETFKEPIVEVDNLGKKTLAYSIKGNLEGHYIVFKVWTADINIEKLEKYYRIDRSILKFITMKLGDEDDIPLIPAVEVDEDYTKINLKSSKSEQSSYPSPAPAQRPRGQQHYDYLFGYTDILEET